MKRVPKTQTESEIPFKNILPNFDFSKICKNGQLEAFDRTSNEMVFILVIKDEVITKAIKPNDSIEYFVKFTLEDESAIIFSLEDSLSIVEDLERLENSNHDESISVLDADNIYFKTNLMSDNGIKKVSS